MNAQQMQELCRELVGALKQFVSACDTAPPLEFLACISKACDVGQKALAKAEQAFNPTPAPTGCVETAATVPSSDGTGETDKALGVGPVCPVCGAVAIDSFPSGDEFACGHVEWKFYDTPKHQFCIHAEHLAITRAKQLAEAERFLTSIMEQGTRQSGNWCAAHAEWYFANKPKEPTT